MISALICTTLLIPQDNQDERLNKLKLSNDTVVEYVEELSAILNNKLFYKELEIVDSQAKQIKTRLNKANKKYGDDMQLAYDQFMETKDKEKYREAVKAIMNQHTTGIPKIFDDILLSHQIKKIDRVIFWSIVRTERITQAAGFDSIRFRSRFENSAVQSALKIDSDQAKVIQKKVTGLQKEFLVELAALHDKYDEKISKELRKEQQQSNKRLLGTTPPFLFLKRD